MSSSQTMTTTLEEPALTLTFRQIQNFIREDTIMSSSAEPSEASTSTSPSSTTPRKRPSSSLDDTIYRSHSRTSTPTDRKLRVVTRKPAYLEAMGYMHPDDMEIDDDDAVEKQASKSREEFWRQYDNKNKRKYDDSVIVCRPKRARKALGDVIYLRGSKPQLGGFASVPPEVLERIAGELPTVADMISFTNTCRTTRSKLGLGNNFFWYNVGKNKKGTNDTFGRSYNPLKKYFQAVKRFSGIESKSTACSLCFDEKEKSTEIETLDKQRLCDNCVRDGVVALKSLKCISKLDVEKLHTFTLDSDKKLRDRTNKFTTYEDNETSTKRMYVWRPRVEKAISRLYRETSFERVISQTEKEREEYDREYTTKREAGEKQLMDMAMEQAEPLYKTIMSVKELSNRDLKKKEEEEKEKENKETTEDNTTTTTTLGLFSAPTPAAEPSSDNGEDGSVLPQHVIDSMKTMARQYYGNLTCMDSQYGRKFPDVSMEAIEKQAGLMVYRQICQNAGWL